jgi:hypothetical protein
MAELKFNDFIFSDADNEIVLNFLKIFELRIEKKFLEKSGGGGGDRSV